MSLQDAIVGGVVGLIVGLVVGKSGKKPKKTLTVEEALGRAEAMTHVAFQLCPDKQQEIDEAWTMLKEIIRADPERGLEETKRKLDQICGAF